MTFEGQWGFRYGDVFFSGGDGQPFQDLVNTGLCDSLLDVYRLGCLTDVPEGLGLPDIRTQDVSYPQRDGVRHFADWYEPRILTFRVMICSEGFGCQPSGGLGFGEGPFGEGPFGGSAVPLSGKSRVRKLIQSWQRQCDDGELVIYTDCHTLDGEDVVRADIGPFGFVGRPRQAQVKWLKPSTSGCAEVILRFDCVDHRAYILDQCGTPGSGVQCFELNPVTSGKCRAYPRCYSPSGSCYSNVIEDNIGVSVEVSNNGDLCSYPTIVLSGKLDTPRVENSTTGALVTYNGIIPLGGSVTLNTEEGTATNNYGSSVTHLLSGNPKLRLDPGTNTIRLTSLGADDTGTAQACYRESVAVV